MSNEAARAARNEALRRHHRRQLLVHRILVVVLLVGWTTDLFHRYLNQPIPSAWRTGEAPALQPYYVVTQGYVTKKGGWASFDNGEAITVYHWLSETP
jgi:hypothetical protein